MPPLLVVDRRLHQVRRALDLSELPADWSRVGGGGLVRADVSGDQWDTVVRSCPGAVAEDRPMGVVVTGSPMDVHGEGKPLPSWARLRSRLDEEQTTCTGEGVLVGTVDTGIRDHAWLAGGYLSAPSDFETASTETPAGQDGTGPAAAQPQAGHGTFVAGLVLQQAPAAGVWVERALATSGQAMSSAVAEAATTLARRGVDVLNLSLGCYADDAGARAVMQRLVDDLREINPRMVIVAAAGNLLGPDQPKRPGNFWPAALDGVVAVGAVEQPDSVSWAQWSNRGPWVDLAAPGHMLLSTHGSAPRGGEDAPGWAWWSGTSFATAVVSGAIARLMTGPEPVSATEAVAQLRDGVLASGWTDPDGDTPSVPVVGLRTWEQLSSLRREALTDRDGAAVTTPA